ncbi:MAG TPA: hypothetical protein VI757_06345, partial [Bacteroidia bacterium]|nr:hypothetical protein [Bacteroidia bacterium]
MKTLNNSVLVRTNIIIMLLAVAFSSAFAEKNGGKNKHANNLKSIAAGCTPSTAKIEMSVNNVRTTIMINGDMWWDAVAQEGPQYEIPKGGQRHSLFAGALWIGGVDASGQLKVAAQTYRQDGSDFWPGPLDMTSASIDPEECDAYNRHWQVKFSDVKAFAEGWNTPGYVIPEVIKNWPGNGDYQSSQDIPNLINPNFTHFLAPYYDYDADGNYDPGNGDYPLFDLSSGQDLCIDDMLHGDEAIWWVFNDVGNIHTETGGIPIGLEIQAQAFAYAKNDEINNMTFYQYKIINRSSASIDTTCYFGVWVDADLGYYLDDYVGCDVPRGLGYCYNGDAEDEGPTGYGFNPPSVGVDFFRGPKADLNDGKDNDRDCQVDESGEQIIMSKFVYYNNDFTDWGNPVTATHYYGYLRGYWKNGQHITYGGDGHGTGNGTTTIWCDFMFPGTTDHALEWGTGGNCNGNIPNPAPPRADWDEYIAGNIGADRRFLQSAGPFTLKPGAVNYIITGALWARSSQGGPVASVSLLQSADDKAQALFDNCFKILNGPDAPDVTIRELNNELILSISNSGSSNNYQETYKEKDPYITHPFGGNDTSFYRFQGYQIFQVVDQTVTSADVHDLDKARLVAQVDIKDQVSQIVNFYFDIVLSAHVPVEEVNGSDKGIVHSFRFTTDAFASGDNRLINHKNYFYLAIAYGFNEDELNVGSDTTIAGGIKQAYIPGRRNVKVYTAIPHNPSPENYGQALNSSYGSGPEITRQEGTGNGYVVDYVPRATLDLTSETVNQILSAATGYKSLHPAYVSGRGPIDVKVYDPVKVPDAQFRLWLDTVSTTARWKLHNLNTNEIESSERDINLPNEQLFPKWGLSVNIAQVPRPMEADDQYPGFVEGTMSFGDPNKQWLSGVSDVDLSDPHPLDWITSKGDAGHDQTQSYEKVLDGTWAPYSLCDPAEGPASSLNGMAPAQNLYRNLPSIDLVINPLNPDGSPDKSKWSKCMVLEVNSNSVLVGGVQKLYAKKRPSLDIDGNPVTDGDSGRSYFPGYAINVESGERLNIMFGEDSWIVSENGNDMLWNPTDKMFTTFGQPLLGGRHYIYIVNTNHDCKNTNAANEVFYLPNYMQGYDGCDIIKTLLPVSGPQGRTRVAKNIAWVGFPLLVTGKQLLSSEVRVRLRVTRPYASFAAGTIVPDGSLVPGQQYVVYEGRIMHGSVEYLPYQYFTAVNQNYSISPTFGNYLGVV